MFKKDSKTVPLPDQATLDKMALMAIFMPASNDVMPYHFNDKIMHRGDDKWGAEFYFINTARRLADLKQFILKDESEYRTYRCFTESEIGEIIAKGHPKDKNLTLALNGAAARTQDSRNAFIAARDAIAAEKQRLIEKAQIMERDARAQEFARRGVPYAPDTGLPGNEL
jgi:hypothetical protein